MIWTPQFAANGWILDLSDRVSDSERNKFRETPIESCIFEDKIYGVPWFTDAGMMYYRKDLAPEEAGFATLLKPGTN